MFCSLLLVLALLVGAQPATSDTSQAKRIRAIEDSLLSPCCYGGSVSTHMSGVAEQMREEISQMVAAGKSNQEIREFYVRQYGQQVLAEPPGAKRVILYAVPVTVSVIGVLFVVGFLRRALHTRRKADTRDERVGANESALRRVRADVGDI